MKRFVAFALALVVVLAAVEPGVAAPWWGGKAPKHTLTPFKSDEELRRFLKGVRRPPPPMPAPPPMAAADSVAPAQAEKSVGSADDKITNTQDANVDEGGIVKVRGDTLVVLRRGRLFTVSARDMRPIDSINAFPPGVDPRSDWYDEMLIAGDRVIVIGYSYGRGGTEINRFHLDGQGRLSFQDAYHLRSNDYYSSRNYASRLIGNRLIVYSPLYLPYGDSEALDWLPALRRWSGNPNAGFTRIVSANEIYVPRQWLESKDIQIDALHTVTDCDLAAPELHCVARSVLGPAGRSFYVSSNAVYVWVTQNRWGQKETSGPTSLLYRMPLDGSAPSAVGVRGAPADQFSFREDWDDGKLNVLVHSEGGGDAMWRPEFSSGSVSLLRFPLRDFGNGDDEVSASYYRPLPRPAGGAFQNRFVGDYVLYGTGTSWGRPQDARSTLVAAAVNDDDVAQIKLSHGVDRIEALGRDAVVVGGDARDLHFQAVELTVGSRPVLGDSYTLENAAQGETRSHGFFFKPWPIPEKSDATAGVLGLPVARAGRPGYRQLAEGSAAIIFLRRANRRFVPLGELGAHDDAVRDDGCRASCVDWYGNARPIFLRDRTFALMGYELVEGEVGPNSIHELRRVNFAPGGR